MLIQRASTCGNFKITALTPSTLVENIKPAYFKVHLVLGVKMLRNCVLSFSVLWVSWIAFPVNSMNMDHGTL